LHQNRGVWNHHEETRARPFRVPRHRHRLRDYIAADRVAVEAMGIDPPLVGHLQYCAAVGLGNYDPAMIDVRGETIVAVKRTYKMRPNYERQIKWKDALRPAAPATPPTKK
jgi:hypothetical protein